MLFRMLALGCNWLIEPIHLDAWQPCFVDFCWGGSPTFKLHIGAPAHVHGRLRRPPARRSPLQAPLHALGHRGGAS